MINSSKLAITMAVLVFVLSSAGMAQTRVVYKPISTTDVGADLAADFAVKERVAKTKTKITPATIVKAEDQEPKLGARNFRLCLKTTVNGKPETARTVITVDQYSNHKLVSWVRSTCDTDDTAFKPIENGDGGAGLAADFAVKERAAKTKSKIAPATIVKAEDQEFDNGARRNFRLCLKTTVNGKPETAQAVITVDQYSNHKLVSWARSTCGGSPAFVVFTPDKDFGPIETTDVGADLAADFAVKERAAKTKTTITPATILKAEGMGPKLGASNYRLCLKTTVNGKPVTAQTVITVDQYSNHKLVSWTDMNCGEATSDDFTPVEKTHAGLGLAADFAVKKHSEDTKIEHKLVEIIKGEAKGMLATTFRICMKVGEEGKTQVIQAVVSMDHYSNLKLVSWEHSGCGN